MQQQFCSVPVPGSSGRFETIPDYELVHQTPDWFSERNVQLRDDLEFRSAPPPKSQTRSDWNQRGNFLEILHDSAH